MLNTVRYGRKGKKISSEWGKIIIRIIKKVSFKEEMKINSFKAFVWKVIKKSEKS